ncbi:MAG TPA: hypothetical protein VFV08_14730 [Puia sp.]|nr:hypothetical protein [Puia sp.]
MPGVSQQSDTGGPEIVLKPVKIVHDDGSTEMVYLEDRTQEKQLNQNTHRNFFLLYMGLTILVLSLTAVISIKHLRDGR